MERLHTSFFFRMMLQGLHWLDGLSHRLSVWIEARLLVLNSTKTTEDAPPAHWLALFDNKTPQWQGMGDEMHTPRSNAMKSNGFGFGKKWGGPVNIPEPVPGITSKIRNSWSESEHPNAECSVLISPDIIPKEEQASIRSEPDTGESATRGKNGPIIIPSRHTPIIKTPHKNLNKKNAIVLPIPRRKEALAFNELTIGPDEDESKPDRLKTVAVMEEGKKIRTHSTETIREAQKHLIHSDKELIQDFPVKEKIIPALNTEKQEQTKRVVLPKIHSQKTNFIHQRESLLEKESSDRFTPLVTEQNKNYHPVLHDSEQVVFNDLNKRPNFKFEKPTQTQITPIEPEVSPVTASHQITDTNQISSNRWAHLELIDWPKDSVWDKDDEGFWKVEMEGRKWNA